MRYQALFTMLRMRAVRTREAAVTRNEFNPLPYAFNGAQIFKPPNCLSHSIIKEGDSLSHAFTVALCCKAPRPNDHFSVQLQTYTNQSFRTGPKSNDFSFTNWRSAPESNR